MEAGCRFWNELVMGQGGQHVLLDEAHDHAEMLRRWMWRDFANITLGIWLLASPATLGYRSTAMGEWNPCLV